MRVILRALGLGAAVLLMPLAARAGGDGWEVRAGDGIIVHVPRGSEQLGRRILAEGEAVLRALSEELTYMPRAPIHVVFRPHGASTADPSVGVVEIALPRPATFRERGHGDWLRTILAHELGHVVAGRSRAGLPAHVPSVRLGGLSSERLGGLLVLGDERPAWVVEGGAEYWSDAIGVQAWSTTRDARLRLATLDGELLDEDEARSFVGRSRNEVEQTYVEGYAFALYLRQRFGRDVLATPRRHGLGQTGLAGFWSGHLRRETGLSLRQLRADWRADLAEHYDAQVKERVARGLVEGSPVGSGSGSWAPLYQSGALLENRQGRLLVDGEAVFSQFVQPGTVPATLDTGILATIVGRSGETYLGRWSAGLRRIVPLADTEGASSAAVSHGRLAFVQWTGERQEVVWSMQDGSERRVFDALPPEAWVLGVDWFPDGRRLLVSLIIGGRAVFWQLDSESASLEPFLALAADVVDPRWTADGTLVFAASLDGIYDIVSFDPITRTLRRQTRVLGAARAPSIGADGALYYSGLTTRGWRSFRLDGSELAQEPVTDSGSPDLEIAAAPRSEHLTDSPLKRAPLTPVLTPFVRFDDRGLRQGVSIDAGLGLRWRDARDRYAVAAQWTLGQNASARLVGSVRTGPVSWFVRGVYARRVTELAERVDVSGAPDPQGAYLREFEQRHLFRAASAGLQVPAWADFSLSVRLREHGLGGAQYEPFLQSALATARLERREERDRWLTGALVADAGVSAVAYRPDDGLDVDDGRQLDRYSFLRVHGRLGARLSLPRLHQRNRPADHALYFGLSGGWINRNVHPLDELRGGGRHPLFFGPERDWPQESFSAYPDGSLSGETSMVARVAYAMPVTGQLDARVGPVRAHQLSMRFSGTAGNFWSFRPPTGACVVEDARGERYAPRGCPVERERIGSRASDSGRRLLGDVSVAVRLHASLAERWPLGSFVRLAIPTVSVEGRGDLDEDGVVHGFDTGLGDPALGERTRLAPRLFVGLGTSW